MKNLICTVTIVVGLLTMADHALRVDWANQCRQGDTITCPDKLWWFQSSCETDADCISIAGVHPLERV